MSVKFAARVKIRFSKEALWKDIWTENCAGGNVCRSVTVIVTARTVIVAAIPVLDSHRISFCALLNCSRLNTYNATAFSRYASCAKLLRFWEQPLRFTFLRAGADDVEALAFRCRVNGYANTIESRALGVLKFASEARHENVPTQRANFFLIKKVFPCRIFWSSPDQAQACQSLAWDKTSSLA